MSSRTFAALASELEAVRSRLDVAWTENVLEADDDFEDDIYDSIKSISAIEEVLLDIASRLRKKEKERL